LMIWRVRFEYFKIGSDDSMLRCTDGALIGCGTETICEQEDRVEWYGVNGTKDGNKRRILRQVLKVQPPREGRVVYFFDLIAFVLINCGFEKLLGEFLKDCRTWRR